MVGTCPRSRFVIFGIYLYPFFGFPVEDVKGIKSLFVGSASSEYDQSVVMLIVVHGAIRPLRRNISSGVNLIPFHGDDIETPDVIHVA